MSSDVDLSPESLAAPERPDLALMEHFAADLDNDGQVHPMYTQGLIALIAWVRHLEGEREQAILAERRRTLADVGDILVALGAGICTAEMRAQPATPATLQPKETTT